MAYAMSVLMRELMGFLRRAYGKDMESAVIMICVCDATMPRDPRSTEGGPGISRRMIADKTGLPRETVRRKVAQLIACKHIVVSDTGVVRAAPRWHETELCEDVFVAHAAVRTYMDFVEAYGVA